MTCRNGNDCLSDSIRTPPALEDFTLGPGTGGHNYSRCAKKGWGARLVDARSTQPRAPCRCMPLGLDPRKRLMARAFRAFTRRFLRRADRSIHVVFARSSVEGSVPIVGVCSTEEEVSELRLALLEGTPNWEVSWSTHKIKGADLDFDGVVHLVTQCGMLSPVVVAAFACERDANRLKDEMVDPGPLFRDSMNVRSLPIGWSAPGQPWLEEEKE